MMQKCVVSGCGAVNRELPGTANGGFWICPEHREAGWRHGRTRHGEGVHVVVSPRGKLYNAHIMKKCPELLPRQMTGVDVSEVAAIGTGT